MIYTMLMIYMLLMCSVDTARLVPVVEDFR